MKRAIKQSSNIYSYLNKIGVLSSGDAEAIAKAKKEYWQLYKREWKKQKRHSSASYTILLSNPEAKVIQKKANQYRTSPTNYIKQAALHGSYIPDNKTIGQIREMFFKYHDTVQKNMENRDLPEPVGTSLLQAIEHIQQTLFMYIKPI